MLRTKSLCCIPHAIVTRHHKKWHVLDGGFLVNAEKPVKPRGVKKRFREQRLSFGCIKFEPLHNKQAGVVQGLSSPDDFESQ